MPFPRELWKKRFSELKAVIIILSYFSLLVGYAECSSHLTSQFQALLCFRLDIRCIHQVFYLQCLSQEAHGIVCVYWLCFWLTRGHVRDGGRWSPWGSLFISFWHLPMWHVDVIIERRWDFLEETFGVIRAVKTLCDVDRCWGHSASRD